ncbi:c-type cytochrome [Sphingomicrobium sediminis]|uniref:Cytochrome c n=1 Tax=Sphingomicrobium sediminis TaxID=2950949 RepID=A0A9X2EGY3_9SPHN|nr:cytochrome c [Sphingomicrobium sediminis]MCM8557287.1 cytochrome c [Sphingomicrobium sediminis]
MRGFVVLLAGASLFACAVEQSNEDSLEGAVLEDAAVTFQGADYGDDEAAKVAHGERVSKVLLCTACHTPTLTGTHMGNFDPTLDGIWASNVTRAVPDLTDEQLETLLREGVHPTRDEIYMMPSKVYQKVSDADMAALIAYLRTLEPTGEPTPLTKLNPGLAEARAAGQYPTSAEEVPLYAGNHPPDPGEEYALGRYVATVNCADCHGPQLDGEDGFAPDLSQMVGTYSDAELVQMLTTGEAPGGRDIGLMSFIGANVTSHLTDEERADLVAYLRKLSEDKMAAAQ